MIKFITSMLVKAKCRFVGADEFGNAYYESRKVNRPFGRKSRHVLYSGIVEASKVPPQWFGWLHFQQSETPKNNSRLYKWEQKHQPNLSGTKHAYFPAGHILGGGERKKATGDYQAWSPEGGSNE